MTVWFAQWTVDVQDTERMATFWAAALGYDDVRRGADAVKDPFGTMNALMGSFTASLMSRTGPPACRVDLAR